MLAAVCGDTMIWKPSSEDAAYGGRGDRDLPTASWRGADSRAVFNLVIGSGSEVGEALINDRRIPLDLRHRVERDGASGSPSRWRSASAVRILELGGNNAVIVMDDADLDLAAAGRALRRGRHRGSALHDHCAG